MIPETPTQTACREWWMKNQPHVKRGWGRFKNSGIFLAEEPRMLHKSWEEAQRQERCQIEQEEKG